mmetsp:Transcript_14517/g.46408  ORF Transcript_14517/g.46408 Transcript_14517/m.46408 type:complete len:210 (-) Transcript_14517:31-660(-)|eukprot:scaffold13157_cov145-Isochrysis_galbana.AAC.2
MSQTCCSGDDGDNDDLLQLADSTGGAGDSTGGAGGRHSGWFSSMIDESQCLAFDGGDAPAGGAAAGGGAASGGWFSSSMASHCKAASSPRPTAPLAPAATAAAGPAVGGDTNVGGGSGGATTGASTAPHHHRPPWLLYSREGHRATATLAGHVEEHMREIKATALGGACTARCPCGRQCLDSVTRNELLRAHEFSFWDVVARPPKPLQN